MKEKSETENGKGKLRVGRAFEHGDATDGRGKASAFAKATARLGVAGSIALPPQSKIASGRQRFLKSENYETKPNLKIHKTLLM
ncbi:MAG: hypothetical protein JF609_06965 [Verrucomicrobia bacterium]|nr:hypothetical protein [Verrucomicrobiota bacterium]